MDEFDVSEFFHYYLNSILIVILTTVIGLVLSWIYTSYIQVPLYRSETSVVLTRADSSTVITQNDITLNKNLVPTYRAIIKSRKILSEVIDNLDLKMKETTLSNKINVSSESETELIIISVTDRDNVQASDIANEIASVFKKQITSIYNIENISIVDEAVPQETPANINVKKQYIMGIGAGFLIGTIIIFILFYFDDTVKMGEDLERKTNLNILASVPKYKKSKK